jgi:hypothetical protein
MHTNARRGHRTILEVTVRRECKGLLFSDLSYFRAWAYGFGGIDGIVHISSRRNIFSWLKVLGFDITDRTTLLVATEKVRHHILGATKIVAITRLALHLDSPFKG